MTLSRQPERMTAAEFRAVPKPKRNKFGAQKTVVDGITFASKAEANFYIALKDREDRGEVSAVEMQRPFIFAGPDGVIVTTYKADFCFWDHVEDRFRVVDVKGVQTPMFRLKRKLMRSYYQIDVELAK